MTSPKVARCARDVTELEQYQIQIEEQLKSQFSSAAERLAEQHCLVRKVIEGYLAVLFLEPLVAFEYEETRRGSKKWSPDSAHYSIDVSNTVRRVIEAKPESDRPELWTAWDNLLADPDGKLGKTGERLVKLLAGPFYTKKLHPALYFRPNPHPQRKTA